MGTRFLSFRNPESKNSYIPVFIESIFYFNFWQAGYLNQSRFWFVLLVKKIANQKGISFWWGITSEKREWILI